MLLFKNIYYALILLSFSILLIRWKKLDKRLSIFAGILLAAFLTEKIRDIFYPHSISKYIYHIYQTVEMLLLSVYYYTLFQRKRNRQIVLTGILIYLVYFYYDFVYHAQNFITDKRSDMMVEGALITIFSVLFLLEIYQQDKPVILKRYAHFWVVFANLLFFSGSLFFSGFTYYLLVNKFPIYEQLSFIIIALNYLLYTLYIIAFLCQPEPKRSA
jgi:hypothetical protein